MNKAPVPQMLKPSNLIRAFYQISPERLNPNGEALLGMVTLDEDNTTPDSLIYSVDDCIESQSEPFQAIADIIGSMLYAIIGDLVEGVHVHIDGQTIIYHPLFIKPLHLKIIQPDPKNIFGNFSAN